MTAGLTTEQAMRAALMAMGPVATELDRIFVETLVNDPGRRAHEDPPRDARARRQSMLRIADFSKLG